MGLLLSFRRGIGLFRTNGVFVVHHLAPFYRPRDILQALDILAKLHLNSNRSEEVFEYSELFAAEFRRQYGDYLVGEIKDCLSFYYDEHEFQTFLDFFTFLHGKNKFTYPEYLDAYAEFAKTRESRGGPLPAFMKSAEEFLQFLYDLNVIAFIERTEGQAGYEASTGDEKFIRWCFRERSPTNISPKVKTEVEYEIHYGLANTLNLGRRLRRTSKTNAEKPEAATDLAQRGRVKWYDPKRGFGFIEQTGLPIDIFLPKRELPKGIRNVAPGQELEYELKRDKSGRLLATSVRLQKSSR